MNCAPLAHPDSGLTPIVTEFLGRASKEVIKVKGGPRGGF